MQVEPRRLYIGAVADFDKPILIYITEAATHLMHYITCVPKRCAETLQLRGGEGDALLKR